MVTKASWGGAQRYVYDLAVAYRDQYEVSVICGRNEFATNSIFTDSLEEAGISYYQIQSMQRNISPLKEVKSFFAMRRLIRRIKPDIIHLNSPKAAGLGGLIAYFNRVSTRVYTLHGMASSENRPAWQKIIIDWGNRLTILMCTDVVVPTQEEYNLAMRWREAQRKLKLIPTGIQVPDHYTKGEALALLEEKISPEVRKRIAGGSKIVLGVGELNANKSWDVLVRALKEMVAEGRDVVMLHMGTGVLEKSLKSLKEDLHLEEQVSFLGFTQDSARYLALADVFVLPSQKELLGYVLLEAATVPLPVVASNTGGIPEIVRDGETGTLCEVGDVAGFARAIERYLDDENQAASHKHALFEHYQKNFSFQNMLEKTQAVYEG